MRVLVLFGIAFLLSACGVSKEETLQKWHTPFVYSAFAHSLCQKAMAAPEEIDRPAYVKSLDILTGFIDEWQPLPGQEGIKEPLRAGVKRFREIVGESGTIAGACLDLETIALEVQDRARAGGLTDEDMRKIIKDAQTP